MSENTNLEPTTLVTFLLDRTSSMKSILNETIDGFNAYVDELRKSPTIEFTFLQFDSISIDKICVALPITDVPRLSRETFIPRASTPLIDAVYETCVAVEESLTKRADNPKVVIAIQTDGEENSSTEHSWTELNAIIKEKAQKGWQFNFMGAGIDAYNQGEKMGISPSSTMSYNSKDCYSTRSAFSSTGTNTRSYHSGTAQSTSYNASQKVAAGDKFNKDLVTDGNEVESVSGLGTPAAKPTLPNAVDDFAI